MSVFRSQESRIPARDRERDEGREEATRWRTSMAVQNFWSLVLSFSRRRLHRLRVIDHRSEKQMKLLNGSDVVASRFLKQANKKMLIHKPTHLNFI